eukprot:2231919-Amphidinium_carterae.2
MDVEIVNPLLLWTLVRTGLGWPAPAQSPRVEVPQPLDEEPDSLLPPGAPWHLARRARIPVPGETRDERIIRQRRWIFARNNLPSPDDSPFAGLEFDPARNYHGVQSRSTCGSCEHGSNLTSVSIKETMRRAGAGACSYNTVAPAKLQAVEQDHWSRANVCLRLATHTLTSLREKISPGSDTSGTNQARHTRAWLYRSWLVSEAKKGGNAGVNHLSTHTVYMVGPALVETCG